MSQVIFNPNTYTGENAGGYISKALLSGRTIETGGITVLPRIKKRMAIRGLDQDVIFQDNAANFNALGDTTIDERYLTPVEIAVMYEMAFKDLRQSWEAATLPAGFNGQNIPTDLATFLVQKMAQKISAGVEKLIWQGKTGLEFSFSSTFPGLLAMANASAQVAKLSATMGALAISNIAIGTKAVVTVTSTANLNTGDRVTINGANNATLVGGASINGQSFVITLLSGTTFSIADTTGTASSAGTAQYVNQSNVVEVLAAVYNASPDAIKSQADYTMYVPMHVADAYRLRQGSVASGAGSYFTTDKPLNFLGRRILELPYFNANTILAARSSNLFFGTDLLADFNSVQVIDMRATTADQKVRYRSTFSADVNFGYPSEVLLYRPQ